MVGESLVHIVGREQTMKPDRALIPFDASSGVQSPRKVNRKQKPIVMGHLRISNLSQMTSKAVSGRCRAFAPPWPPGEAIA
jgi:hypothetical protein